MIKMLATTLSITACLLAVSEILIINRYAVKAEEVQKADIQTRKLHTQNDILLMNIASASSLLTISQEAKLAGFVEPTKSQYMTMIPDNLPVAINNPL
jgi:hypothetical protein